MSGIVDHWRAFRDDEPGQRFCNHFQRMRQQGSRAGRIVRISLGLVLMTAGVVMLVAPGPGLLGILFGLGLLGGESEKIASTMDRVEPSAREHGDAYKQWWKQQTRVVQVFLGLAVVAVLAIGGYQMWRWIFG
ncbi:MAG TPA: PGPGW domain-containing protein [Kofleriaceae bacterium]|nr:PGPGW domain-containing protein [Kofleriaceae bacterium]